MEMDDKFGTWLYSRRKEKGLTQEQLAGRAGISKAYIGHLENARPNTQGVPTMPDRDKVAALAKALGAPVPEALIAAGYAADTSVESHDLDGVFVSFDGAASLTDEEKTELLSAVRLIAQGIKARKAQE